MCQTTEGTVGTAARAWLTSPPSSGRSSRSLMGGCHRFSRWYTFTPARPRNWTLYSHSLILVTTRYGPCQCTRSLTHRLLFVRCEGVHWLGDVEWFGFTAHHALPLHAVPGALQILPGQAMGFSQPALQFLQIAIHRYRTRGSSLGSASIPGAPVRPILRRRPVQSSLLR